MSERVISFGHFSKGLTIHMQTRPTHRREPTYDKRTAFVRQAAILAVSATIVRIMGFAYRLPLTHIIGDEGNGIGGIGHTIYLFFFILSSAGLPVAISKMVSERIAAGRPDEARRVFHISLAVAFLLGSVLTGVLALSSEFIVNMVGSHRSYYALLALAPTVFVVSVMSVFRGYFQGMQNTAPTAMSQLIEQLFLAVFSVLLAYVFMQMALPYEYGGDPVAYGAAGGQLGKSIGALAGLMFIGGYYLHKRREINQSIHYYTVGQKNKRQGAFSIVRELGFIAVPLILGTAIFSMSNIIDMVMVQRRLEVAGIMDGAMREALYGQLVGKYVTITNLPVGISTALAIVAIPSIAASIIKRNHKDVNEKINTAIRISMLISIPSAVGIGVLANQILLLMFPSHPEGGTLLAVGSISILFLAFYQIIAGMLQAVGKLHIPVIAAFVGAFIKIPLNFVLIAHPSINIVGAVISTTVCYAVASGICWHFFKKYIKFRIDIANTFIKPAAAAIGMGLCCFIFYHMLYYIGLGNAFSTISAIIFGVVVYFAFLLMLGGLRRNDVRLLPMGSRICAALERRGLI